MVIDRKDLRDLGEVTAFVSLWESSPSLMLEVRSFLVDGESVIMSLRDRSAYFILEAKGSHVAVIHMYCTKASRGKKMKSFVREVRDWVRDNTEFKYIFNYTRDFKAQLIMRTLGSRRIGEYRGYVVYKQTIDREV